MILPESPANSRSLVAEPICKGEVGRSKQTPIQTAKAIRAVGRKWFDIAWEKHSTFQSTVPLICVWKNTQTLIKRPRHPREPYCEGGQMRSGEGKSLNQGSILAVLRRRKIFIRELVFVEGMGNLEGKIMDNLRVTKQWFKIL